VQYVIGVVPPPAISERIVAFQRAWAENTDPDIVEAHTTVKAQGGLSDDLKWLEEAESLAAQTQPFEVTLGSPSTFGDSVAFLSASSDALAPLHEALVRIANPSPELLRRYFERPGEFVSHLTLGMTTTGLTERQIQEMADRASSDLSGIPPFQVEFIRVYRECEPTGSYGPFQDVPLCGRLR